MEQKLSQTAYNLQYFPNESWGETKTLTKTTLQHHEGGVIQKSNFHERKEMLGYTNY